MNCLYIDTSNHVVVGLLNDSFNWIDFFENKIKKTSGTIHLLVNELLSKNNIELEDIDCLIQSSGPGSYTGMRVSEGFAQILQWQDRKIFSFYHYEIPSFYGVKKGIWVSNAFKNEFFVYEWDGDKGHSKLLKVSEFNNIIDSYDKTEIYTNFLGNINCNNFTGELINNSPHLIFPAIVKRSKHFGPYYYRPLTDEFKMQKRQK